MAYCIVRVAKLKSRASLIRAAQHNTRERIPANADPNPAIPQRQGLKSVQAIMDQYTKALPAKVRANAVHALEFVVTQSPDAWADIPPRERIKKTHQYLMAAQGWLTDKFGGKDNLLSARMHYDEKTPHMHVLIMPLKDGKLNARHFIGGARDVLKDFQTAFFKEVGQEFGLDRGRPREETQNRHVHIKEYYAKMDELMAKEREIEAMTRKADIARLAALKAKRQQSKGKDGLER